MGSNLLNVGTLLQLDRVEQRDNGSIEVRAIASCVLRIAARSVRTWRLDAQALPMMVDGAEVSQIKVRVPPSGRGAALKRKVWELIAKLPGRKGEAEGAPQEITAFSWWSVRQLPLPQTSKGYFLGVHDVEERLDLCSRVLVPF